MGDAQCPEVIPRSEQRYAERPSCPVTNPEGWPPDNSVINQRPRPSGPEVTSRWFQPARPQVPLQAPRVQDNPRTAPMLFRYRPTRRIRAQAGGSKPTPHPPQSSASATASPGSTASPQAPLSDGAFPPASAVTCRSRCRSFCSGSSRSTRAIRNLFERPSYDAQSAHENVYRDRANRVIVQPRIPRSPRRGNSKMLSNGCERGWTAW